MPPKSVRTVRVRVVARTKGTPNPAIHESEDEIESERRWDQLFAQSPDKLSRLADKAWVEHEAGLSEELDPDKP